MDNKINNSDGKGIRALMTLLNIPWYLIGYHVKYAGSKLYCKSSCIQCKYFIINFDIFLIYLYFTKKHK